MLELVPGSVVTDDNNSRYLITHKSGLFVQAIAIADMEIRYEADSYERLLDMLRNLVGVKEVIEPRRVHVEIDDHRHVGD